MSSAVSTLSKLAPSLGRLPANDERSTLDKMISLNCRPREASAAGESANAGQSGTDPASRRASESVTSAPSSCPSPARLRRRMPG